jgi:16S rRNA (guanine527-N7)-methyltransferase
MAEGAVTLEKKLLSYGIEPEKAQKLVHFWELVSKENEIQNLTRILDPETFAEEHIRDSWELHKAGWILGKALDLGTGGGFPGIPCAILGTATWVLVDSERNKVDFVKRAIAALDLKNASAVHGRAEDVLRAGHYDFVVSRAVGPIHRIYGWISKCSTWNNLVLLKGPKWDEEWLSFKDSPGGRRLMLRDTLEYSVGPESKKRKTVWLSRL